MELPSPERFRRRDWAGPDDGVLNLALVGLGEFTTGWVAPSAADSEYAAVGAMVSSSAEKARREAAEYGATGLTYEEFEAGTEHDAYDAVYIATPNATHERYVRAAAERGTPVLCEKPLAATLDGARSIATLVEDAGITLQVAYRLQTDPVVRWARAAIQEGAIGEPQHATGTMAQDLYEQISPDPEQWRLDHDLSGGAALIDLGIYPLNTTRFLLAAAPATAIGSTWSVDPAFAEVDEHAAVLFTYENGVRGAFTASQQSARGDHLTVYGTEGSLTLDPAFFGDVTARLERGDQRLEVAFPAVNEMREQLDYFASHVLRGAVPEPDIHHGVTDMAALAAAYESADTGAPVTVDDA